MVSFVQALQAEALRCHDAGLTPRFWWRDDDLIAPSENLRRLHDLARDCRVRCLTAVIPALCEDGLGDVLSGMPGLLVCQHGYKHENHEPDGRPKNEFGPGRPRGEVYDEIGAGLRRMRQVFGEAFAPVFVGPWNRCAPDFAPVLVDLGFRGWSGFAGEPMRPAHPQLRSIDTHVDVVAWSAAPQLQPLEAIAAQLARRLAGFREAADMRSAREPTPDAGLLPPVGVLTHHRVFKEDAWSSIGALFTALTDIPGAEWVDPASLFAV